MSRGYKHSHIYSIYCISTFTHTKKQHTAVLRGIKKNPSLGKLTLKFICVSFSLTFSLVSSQSLAARHRYFLRCVHIATRSGKKKGGKKNADRLFHQLEGALLYALTAAAPRKTPLIVPHNFRLLVKWVLTTFARL